MYISKHRLHHDSGQAVAFEASPNMGGALKPDTLVMHYTAGANAASSIETLTDPSSRASAHLVIAKDGTITQLVPFNRVAWHAGRSRWPGPDGEMRAGLNRYSVGIELDNEGRLQRQGGGWVTWYGEPVADERVIVGPHENDNPGAAPSGWPAYPLVQIEAAIEAARAICAGYFITEIVGHDDISPVRKSDPGRAFPKESFVSRVLGRDLDDWPAHWPEPSVA